MINFIKGLLSGIGNIAPGISGSGIMVISGLYNKCIKSISELSKFKNIKYNFLFLLPIALGIIIGTISFANVIDYFIDKNEFLTSLCFFGLIIGTIPFLWKEANKEKFKISYLIPFFITIGISLLLTSGNTNTTQYNELSGIQNLILGIIYSFSTVIPGISSTVIFTMMGYYDTYVNIMTFPFDYLYNLTFILIGFSITTLFISNIIYYLLKNFYSYSYYAICGFVIITMPKIIRGTWTNTFELIIGILIFLISFVLVYSIGKIEKK
ncbi:MAG: DUF368 domain-containing protein [Bacilli bacterium]